MGAADATLTQAIERVTAHFGAQVQFILDGQFAFWIGSGISRERFPDLKELLLRLLHELHTRSNFSDDTCPWRLCLQRVLELVHVSPDTTRQRDIPADWPDIDQLLDLLVDNYSDVLDNPVYVGTTPQSLSLDVLGLDRVYGDDTIDPDAEHRLLALLIEEGIVAEIVSANWDPLIERAHEEARDGQPSELQVVVRAADIDGTVRTRLTKIHGCARRLRCDPVTWRDHMIATTTEIQNWVSSPDRAPVRELIRTTLRQKPTLFLGLSVQDWNLQLELLKAFSDLEPPLPIDPPRALFAESELRQPQRTVLRHIHGEEYARQPIDVEENATLDLYGKPLLGSLFILTLLTKVRVIAASEDEAPIVDWMPFLLDAIDEWGQYVCERFDALADPGDCYGVWRNLVDEVAFAVARFMRVYLEYIVPVTDLGYYAISDNPVNAFAERVRRDPRLRAGSVLLLLGALLRGQRNGQWELKRATGSDGRHGQFSVLLAGRRISLFILSDYGCGSEKLHRNGYTDPSHNVPAVIAYATGNDGGHGRHSPARPMHSRSSSGPKQIWLQDLAATLNDPDALVDTLRNALMEALP